MLDLSLLQKDKDEFKSQVIFNLYSKAKTQIEQKKKEVASDLFSFKHQKEISSS